VVSGETASLQVDDEIPTGVGESTIEAK